MALIMSTKQKSFSAVILGTMVWGQNPLNALPMERGVGEMKDPTAKVSTLLMQQISIRVPCLTLPDCHNLAIPTSFSNASGIPEMPR